ncbi:hypothetical protein F3Y22_tig00110556pilonHSYRG00270 [Hibiscus syriacus]|uniref:Uncharacterized protein n=1 Tax=Hibiscus syriacus TaxID=106335 RepID=A0A6A3A823_HIBSY|nr:hypothetical protein F3Y22_tig00110556pilonHSYRG00270 [Hibiscus syriacus]
MACWGRRDYMATYKVAGTTWRPWRPLYWLARMATSPLAGLLVCMVSIWLVWLVCMGMARLHGEYMACMATWLVAGRAWRPGWSPGVHGDLVGRRAYMATYPLDDYRSVMEEGKLNFNAQLLSVRRLSSAHSLLASDEQKIVENSSCTREDIFPSNNSDVNWDHVKDPFAVPFEHKIPATDTRWETIVKSSYLHHHHVRCSEELVTHLSQQSKSSKNKRGVIQILELNMVRAD